MKFLTISLFMFSALVCHAQPDIILHNGKVFTADRAGLWAEAIAIAGTRISAVGNDADVLKLKGSQTRVIDLQGHVVVPGFNDAHAHLGASPPGREFALVTDPAQPTPWEVVRDSITKIVREVPTGTWIRTSVNPDLFEDARAQRQTLDRLAPNHPVLLSGWTGHGKIMNTPALQIVGLDERSVIAGGRIHRTKDGGLNGHVHEYAGFNLSLLLAANYSTERIVGELQSFHRNTASWGLTTMQNMCSSFTPARAQEVYASPDFTCRTRLIAFPETDERQLRLEEWKPLFRTLNHLTYGSGVKMVLDGTPVERLACMRERYHDRDTHGMLNFLHRTSKRFYALRAGQQPADHDPCRWRQRHRYDNPCHAPAASRQLLERQASAAGARRDGRRNTR